MSKPHLAVGNLVSFIRDRVPEWPHLDAGPRRSDTVMCPCPLSAHHASRPRNISSYQALVHEGPITVAWCIHLQTQNHLLPHCLRHMLLGQWFLCATLAFAHAAWGHSSHCSRCTASGTVTDAAVGVRLVPKVDGIEDIVCWAWVRSCGSSRSQGKVKHDNVISLMKLAAGS